MAMKRIIQALGVANPPLYATQRQAFEVYTSLFTLAPEEAALYQRLLLDGTIQGRYVGMDRVEDACETDPDRLNERFLKYARSTAAAAARRGLAFSSGPTAPRWDPPSSPRPLRSRRATRRALADGIDWD